MSKYRYPCTGYITMNGFGAWLEKETKTSRYNIRQLENELKQQFSVPYLTLVNSGSSANMVAALVLAEKVKKAGKPMTAAVSAFTFPTTISALSLAGFDLAIVDTEENGFNISLSELKKLDPVPSVFAVTHFLGFPCDIVNIVEFARQNGSFMLQDCCETLGMEVDNRPVFYYGDISTWSCYHPHHLSSYGGGAVITLSEDDYFLADSTAHWGRACKCHIDEELCDVPAGPAHQFTYERIGLNVEMSELNACFGRWQLRDFSCIEQKRMKNYSILYETLKNSENLCVWKAPETKASAFVFPVRLLNGMDIIDAYNVLCRESIEMRTLMGGVSNEQNAFKTILGTALQPNAHETARTTFFVGIHHTLPEADVCHVSDRLLKLFR